MCVSPPLRLLPGTRDQRIWSAHRRGQGPCHSGSSRTEECRELRSFLGMVNYYGKFPPDLATTLVPLYQLLRKRTYWGWKQKQQRAFQQVKDLLHSGRVLTHFDDRLPLVLACDASPYGLGAVLSHRTAEGEEKPVGFASRTLTKAESNYSHLDKESYMVLRNFTNIFIVDTSASKLITNR